MTKIKLITFDLDDTLWDNGPTITNAEIQTRKWIEERVGEVEWGNFEDFIELRNVLNSLRSFFIFSMHPHYQF